MKFLKKGIEFNNLAKGFNGTYIMINELEVKIKNHDEIDYSDFHEDFFIVAYLCRREIIDRLETYGWGMHSPLMIPMMSRGRVTLLFAYQQTVGRLMEIANTAYLSDEVRDILDKGETYYEIDRIIPPQIKNSL